MTRLAVALALAGALSAQAEVRIHSCVGGDATRLARQSLAALLPRTPVAFDRSEDIDLVRMLRAGDADVDVVFGLDALYALALAGEGRFASYQSPQARSLGARYRGPEDRFVVPLLSPIAIAFARTVWSREDAPRSFDDLLFDPRYFDQLVLTVPQAQAALWMSWVQQQTALGGAERALAWQRTLDARVVSYEPSIARVLVALGDGRASLAVLPVAVIRSADGVGLDFAVPKNGMPTKGLAVGIVSGSDEPAARRVYDALASKEFAVAMMAANLVASPRADLPAGEMPVPEWAAASMLPYATDDDMEHWFLRWHESVRGMGKTYDWLDTVLEGGFAIGFAIFLYFVYRRLQSSEGRPGDER